MCSPNAGPRERELYRKWKENNPDTPFPISPVQKDPTTNKTKSTTRKRNRERAKFLCSIWLRKKVDRTTTKVRIYRAEKNLKCCD